MRPTAYYILPLRALTAAFALLLLSFPAPAESKDHAELLSAQRFLHSARWNDAFMSAQQILSSRPNSIPAHKLLLAAARGKKDIAAARAFLQSQSAQHPRNPYIHYGLALCAKEELLYPLAAQELRKAIRLAPDFADPFVDLAEVHQAMNDLASCQTFFADYVRAHPRQANGYVGLGYCHRLRSEWDLALRHLDHALRLDPKNLTAYWKKSALCINREKYEEFLRCARKIIQLAEAQGCYDALQKNYSNLGVVYTRLNQPASAIEAYQKALIGAEQVGDEKSQMRYTYEIGTLRIAWEGPDRALPDLQVALQLSRSQKDSSYQAWTLLRLGTAYRKQGHWDEAQRHYQQSLALFEQSRDQEGIVYGWKNLGDLQQMIGEYGPAMDYYKKAMTLAESEKIPNQDSLQEMILSNLGLVSLRQGRFMDARRYYEQALLRADRRQDPLGRQAILGQMGTIHLKMEQPNPAITYLNQALDLAEKTQQKEDAAFWLIRLGDARRLSRHYQESLSCYRRAQERGLRLRHPRILREATAGLGATMEALGKDTEALVLYREAISQLEAERDRLVLEKEQSGFFEDKMEIYEKIIRLLVTRHRQDPGKNYVSEAFAYSERAKAQAFLQKLPHGQFLRQLKQVSPAFGEWASRRQSELDQNYRQLIQKHGELQDSYRRDLKIQGLAALEASAPPPAVVDRQNEIAQLETRIAQLEKEHIQFLKTTRARFPSLARFYEPEILDTAHVQSWLPAGEVLIEYHLQPGKSFVFVISRDRVEVLDLPLNRAPEAGPRALIESMVYEYRQAKKRPKPVPPGRLVEQLHSLYRQIFQPLEKYLTPGTPIILIPDDDLHYLPFGMLVVDAGGRRPQFLGERYPISYAYSASLRNPSLWQERKRNRRPTLDLLALGNPGVVSEKPSLLDWFRPKAQRPKPAVPAASKNLDEPLSSLPYAEKEVQGIGRYFKHSEVLIGPAASEAAFKALAPTARVIHMAAHNALDTQDVWSSRIILARQPAMKSEGEDGFLHTYEISNLDLEADLVVLSACETGLGRLKRGEGLVGMSRAFLYAGAPSLVASLWPVSDDATAELMQRFYGYLAQGIGKRQALQQAQTHLLESGYTHPFYWAPFILIGEAGVINVEKPSTGALGLGLFLLTASLGLVWALLRRWISLRRRIMRQPFS